MKKNCKLSSLAVILAAIPTLIFAQHRNLSGGQPNEIATLDAVATMLGSANSWIRNQPEAAIHLFSQHERMLAYSRAKLEQYSSGGAERLGGRRGDRKKQLEHCIRSWEDTVPRYKEAAPKQIATELERQRKAVARYRKSKRPRPSSFAYIPKSVWNTKDKLNVLTASGVDTTALQKEQQQVEKMVLDVVASIDAAELAKSNSAPRDGYRRDDRPAMERFVAQLWKKEHADKPIARFVMPHQSWTNSYGATIDPTSGEIVPHEVDRITVYVAVKKSDAILTLYPIRLARLNYKINGRRLGKIQPQAMQRITTNEFPFDVLAKKIR